MYCFPIFFNLGTLSELVGISLHVLLSNLIIFGTLSELVVIALYVLLFYLIILWTLSEIEGIALHVLLSNLIIWIQNFGVFSLSHIFTTAYIIFSRKNNSNNWVLYDNEEEGAFFGRLD